MSVICSRCSETLVNPDLPCGFCVLDRRREAVATLIAASGSDSNASLLTRAEATETLRNLGHSREDVLDPFSSARPGGSLIEDAVAEVNQRQPGDRAMRVYAREWLYVMTTLDEKATGFYVTLLLRCESEPVVPGSVVAECGETRWLRKRYIRDLSGFAGLVIPEGRDLRLVEWREPSSRWRWFGRPGSSEPIAAVSRTVVAARSSLPRGLREFVLERDGRTCGICQEAIPENETPDIDHIVPIARGGGHAPENLQVTHASCNRSKGARILGGAA